jgi:hypothetical protein
MIVNIIAIVTIVVVLDHIQKKKIKHLNDIVLVDLHVRREQEQEQDHHRDQDQDQGHAITNAPVIDVVVHHEITVVIVTVIHLVATITIVVNEHQSSHQKNVTLVQYSVCNWLLVSDHVIWKISFHLLVKYAMSA